MKYGLRVEGGFYLDTSNSFGTRVPVGFDSISRLLEAYNKRCKTMGPGHDELTLVELEPANEPLRVVRELK